MKLFLMLAIVALNISSAFAIGANQACREYREIQRITRAIDARGVEAVLPHADWTDERYRRQDQRRVVVGVGKTIVMVMIQRLSPLSYLFDAGRAEAATVTGSFIRSPQSFQGFLNLSTQQGCRYLAYPDSSAQRLRDVTHEVYLELRRAQR